MAACVTPLTCCCCACCWPLLAEHSRGRRAELQQVRSGPAGLAVPTRPLLDVWPAGLAHAAGLLMCMVTTCMQTRPVGLGGCLWAACVVY